LLGDDGALLGAAAVGLDVVAAPEALAAWAEGRQHAGNCEPA